MMRTPGSCTSDNIYVYLQNFNEKNMLTLVLVIWIFLFSLGKILCIPFFPIECFTTNYLFYIVIK